MWLLYGLTHWTQHKNIQGGRRISSSLFVTVMVCIAIKGKPIVGVIHQPYDAEGKSEKGGVTKWAWVGHDSSLSLTKAVEPHSSNKNTDNVRVIVSRSHAGDVTTVAEDAPLLFAS